MSSTTVSKTATVGELRKDCWSKLFDNAPPPMANPREVLRDHPPTHTDPIIQAIDRLIEPRWIEGTMHVQRLRALADCEALTHHPDVSAWLRDLANIIQEMS
jgi:hypothetical protein